ncbi:MULTISPECIES: porin [Comamonas]|jgi:predicted porin|uniref:Porin n=1 Tax=Comamonas terrigena TaxID=32013 RepID=A0A2A7USW9_COMTR|nr:MULTISPECIES: porin [Comamonas]MBD9533114.1 porin [Comamonas sp. CMM01]MDH1290065.1 porin [Comamonas terrigena]PEH88362.1 porin [Comamonas terrigena]SUY87701.1 Outer membrane porin protein 32 precursor [Comamonas terrigena]
MNKTIWALAVAAMLPVLSLAQSHVTISGRLVGGAEYIDKIANAQGGTDSLTRAANNQWGTSMLGFSGSEDLGAGTKAIFNLEGGFGSSTGDFSNFNRRAFVGLSSKSMGTLQVGRNLLNSNDVWNLDPTGQQFMGSATLVQGRNWQGLSNAIEYTTPNMAGLTVNAQYGFGEKADNSKANRSEGLSAAYTQGNLEVRAIYTSRRDAMGSYSDVYKHSQEAIIGATYRWGAAKWFTAYDHVKAKHAKAGAPDRLKHGWVGVRYDATPQLTLIGAGYRVLANPGHGSATLLMLGADYRLSKRTFLYASLGGVSNSAQANFAADVSVSGPGKGASQRVLYAGVGHSF